MTDKSYGQI